MQFENCDNFEFSPESGSEVKLNDFSGKLKTLQKEQNIKVSVTPEEIVDAFNTALRQNCKNHYLTSQLFEEVRSISNGRGNPGFCATIPPFPYMLEFVKDATLFRVYQIKKSCAPKIDVSERSMKRITGRLECSYKSYIAAFEANEIEMMNDKNFTFNTIVLFVFI
jgi:hypothetical protein